MKLNFRLRRIKARKTMERKSIVRKKIWLNRTFSRDYSHINNVPKEIFDVYISDKKIKKFKIPENGKYFELFYDYSNRYEDL
jgi:hypothetical protein